MYPDLHRHLDGSLRPSTVLALSGAPMPEGYRFRAGMGLAAALRCFEFTLSLMQSLDAVRRVAAGQSLLDPAVTTKVLERLRKGGEEDERLAHLTPQERNILELIAEGLTNRQIAERVHLAEKTVKNYVSNLLAKLGMERRTQAAVYAARLQEHRNQPPTSS